MLLRLFLRRPIKILLAAAVIATIFSDEEDAGSRQEKKWEKAESERQNHQF